MAKKNKSRHNIELQYNTSEVLVPALILLAFTVFILLGITGIVDRIVNKPEEIDIEAQIWEESFRRAEQNRVGIIFNPISTTNSDYNRMQDNALQFAEEEYKVYEADAQVEVNTVVDEKLYVDGADPDSVHSENIDMSKDMRETGPIYFNDMLMLRYITEDGHMRVVLSLLDSERDRIESTKQSNLINLARRLGRTNEIVKDGIPEEVIERLMSIDSSQSIKEGDYLLGLADATIQLLKTQSINNISEAERKAIKYYTVDGKETVYGSRTDIPIEADSEVTLEYIAAGRSDTSKNTKDRIYMQLSITHTGDETSYVYIVLKLNSNLRIFDIDIL